MSTAKLSLQEIVRNPNTFKVIEGQHHRYHAKELDKVIGYKSAKIETKLLQKYRAYDQNVDPSSNKSHYEGTQTWIGLHPQALQTSYNELYHALIKLEEFEINSIVDIGAAYGRVGVVGKAIFPDASFTGYEILKTRQAEANRVFDLLGLDDCTVHLKNVLDQDFEIPCADVYFLYDFSEMEDICVVLDQISARMKNEKFFIITKGDRLKYLVGKKYKEFWLANHFIEVGELKIFSSFVELGN